MVRRSICGAALADHATDVGAGEADVLAQKMRKEQARLDILFIDSTVDRHVDRFFHRTDNSFRH